MNKLFTTLFLGLFMAIGAEASSGTCSSHNGINCSAGADWDGSVICNDGWHKSSESYGSAAMCSSFKWCSYSERNILENQYGLTEKITEYNNLQNQVFSIDSEYEAKIASAKANPYYSESVLNSKLAQIASEAQSKINALNFEISAKETGLESLGDRINIACSKGQSQTQPSYTPSTPAYSPVFYPVQSSISVKVPQKVDYQDGVGKLPQTTKPIAPQVAGASTIAPVKLTRAELVNQINIIVALIEQLKAQLAAIQGK